MSEFNKVKKPIGMDKLNTFFIIKFNNTIKLVQLYTVRPGEIPTYNFNVIGNINLDDHVFEKKDNGELLQLAFEDDRFKKYKDGFGDELDETQIDIFTVPPAMPRAGGNRRNRSNHNRKSRRSIHRRRKSKHTIRHSTIT